MSRFLLLISGIFIACAARAQHTHLFTSDYDLTSSLINTVCYDSDGFIWVGTEDGLNRFDGSKFTQYGRVEGDTTWLAHNFVNTVYEDRDNNLLIGTYDGLQVYDPVTERFSSVAPYIGSHYNASNISQILQLQSGKILCLGGTVAYADISDPHNPKLHEIPELTSRIKNVPRGIEDADGDLWLVVEDNGVHRVSPDMKVRKYLTSASDPEITCFAIGTDGTLYAGTDHHGLLRFDRGEDTFVPTTPYKGRLSVIKQMCPTDDGRILVGTDGTGVKIYDPASDTMTDYPLSFIDSNSLKVHTLTRDAYDNIWIGLYQKGVMMVPPRANGFDYIGHKSMNPTVIGQACATAVLSDRSGCLWVGTDNDHLYRLDSTLTRSQHYTGEDMPRTILSLFEDSQGQIFIGSYDKGGGMMANGRYKRLPINDACGRPVQRIYGFSEDSAGNIWIATMGAGVFLYDRASGHISHPQKVNEGVNPWTTSISYDAATDILYIGTYDGLYTYQGNTIKHHEGTCIVLCMLPQTDFLWVGTDKGLIKHRADGTMVKRYTFADGLPSDNIYGILADGDDLWVSTNSGLLRFDTKAEVFTNFSIHDGLQGNEFSKNAAYRDANGKMYFAGTNGITLFDPQEVSTSGRKGHIRVTDLYYNDNVASGGAYSGSRMVTDRPVFDTDVFRLSPDDRHVIVEFSLKEFFGITDCTYYYSLDGQPWEVASRLTGNDAYLTGAKVVFSRLPYGKHTLRLKALVNGTESEVRSIEIDIAYPWWQSWWAKIIYVLAFAASILTLAAHLRRRRKRLLLEQHRKHQEELKDTRLQFFTNISHEIRTPMSLIISPVQKLISSDNDPQRQSLYRTILRNSNRIMRLMNEIMDLRKLDNRQMKMTYQQTDLVAFVTDLYNTFAPTAEIRHQHLALNHPGCDTLMMWIDPVNLDKVLMNLISNALKYTPAEGTVTIDIATDPKGSNAVISVTDTGIGISEAERDHIFERFYRVKGNSAQGTGIGLHLTKRLVDLHGGTLTVADNPNGAGTVFTVTLPLGDSHIAPEDKTSPQDQVTGLLHANLDNNEELMQPVTPDDEKNKTGNLPCIVIAEDDSEIRRYLTHHFSRRYRVEVFDNGTDALNYVLRNGADLVISDVMMPGTDGLTLTRRIKDNINRNHTPVILVSAKALEQDMVAGLESGADDYMAKPFNIEILFKKAESMLKSRRQLRNAYTGSQDQTDKVEAVEAMSDDERLLERVMKAVNRNLGNRDLTIEMLAQEIGISRVHLNRKLKEITNQTSSDFIRNLRLKQAARLLSEKKLTIAEVSDMVGFKNPGNFSTAFKQLFGMPPTEYAQQNRDEAGQNME